MLAGPLNKKACFTSNFFPFPGRVSQKYRWRRGQNVDAAWFGSQLQPLIAINPFSVFNAQQGSRGNACTSSRGLVA